MRVRSELAAVLLLVSKNHLSLVSGQPPTSVPTMFPTADLDSIPSPIPVDFNVELTTEPTISIGLDDASLTPTITETDVTNPTTMPSLSPSDEPSLSLAPSTMPPPSTSPSQTPTKAPVTVVAAPTTIPTAAPIVRTGVPTPEPTMIPSVSPTTTPESPVVPVEGRLDLTLAPVTSLLMSTTRSTFLEATTAFLYQQLPLLQQDSLIVQVVGQSLAQRRLQLRLLKPQQTRHLQTETLALDLSVTGLLYYGLNTTSTGSFQERLQQVFLDHVEDFLDALQDTSDPYFDTITEVSIPSSAPVFSPTTLPPAISNTEPPTNDKDDPFLSMAAIIGIGVGGGVLVLLLIFLLYRAMQEPKAKNNRDGHQSFTSDAPLSGDDNGNGSSRKNKTWMQKRTESKPKKEGYDAASDMLYSYQDNASASFAMGGPNHFDTDTLAGGDTLSYAYSLEAGIEPSVMDMDMDSAMGGDESMFTAQPQSSQSSSRVQIPSEFPTMVPLQIGTSNNNNNSNQRPSSSHWSSHSSGVGGNPSEFGVNPAVDLNSPTGSDDLELTQSELAMLPSNLNLAATTSTEEYIPTRHVYAPPGKLGIVIDTTVEGPVVHKVNSGSALEEQIWPGDIIVAIDDVDTRAMSASAITELMVQTAHQRRKLTVVSGEA